MADTGGNAFPVIEVHQKWNRDTREWDGVQTNVDSYGMSLRDYFAAKAMQALASQLLEWNSEVKKSGETLTERANVMLPDISDVSYKLADAMLAEREK